MREQFWSPRFLIFFRGEVVSLIASEGTGGHVTIREEQPEDQVAIREVNRLAFSGEDEALLVDRLREEKLVICSLVAVEASEVVGHILFSRLPVETQHAVLEVAALAPMAVRPDHQRRGVGLVLVRTGLEVCRQRGVPAVVVLGHPEYYPRFGFSSQLAEALLGPFDGPAWMALELRPGGLAGVTGTVHYPDAFGLVL